MLSEDELREIERRCEAATPGPKFATAHRFASNLDGSVWTISTSDTEPGWETDCGYDGYGLPKADAEFYAQARADVPALIDHIREQQAQLRQVQAEARHIVTEEEYATIVAMRVRKPEAIKDWAWSARYHGLVPEKGGPIAMDAAEIRQRLDAAGMPVVEDDDYISAGGTPAQWSTLCTVTEDEYLAVLALRAGLIVKESLFPEAGKFCACHTDGELPGVWLSVSYGNTTIAALAAAARALGLDKKAGE